MDEKDQFQNSQKASPKKKPPSKRIVDIALRYDIATRWEWWLCFAVIAVMGLCTRLYYLTVPNFVIWDEAHFGKMASWYLNRTHFFDVHPPGGKLLLTLFGYLSGYNGTHSFEKPGTSYEGFPQIMGMRLGCALLGAGIVPFSFASTWNLTNGSLLASILAGLMTVYEIGLITLSKFILLDPPLFFFVMMTFHAFSMFVVHNKRPWTRWWYLSLGYMGLALGCVVSVKFVGLLTVLVIGFHTVTDLWQIFGNTAITLKRFGYHFLARAIALIIVPSIIYIAIFGIHDVILDRTQTEVGKGDLGMSSYSAGFQMVYKNSSLDNLEQPVRVAYGNVVTFRLDELGGSYLHSHNFTYPTSIYHEKIQQVTGYKGKDPNNFFRILFPSDDPDLPNKFYSGDIEMLNDGTWIRLFHPATNSTVSCSRNKSAIASKLTLVYAEPYTLTPTELAGQEVDVSPRSLWIVKTEKSGDFLEALKTRFQLINAASRCALVWTKEVLPMKWYVACLHIFRA